VLRNAPIEFSSFNIYTQDESRFGLFKRNGRALTAKGVKPICTYQHKFENTYLFGTFSPINGANFMMELLYCNAENFQLFLNEFSEQNPSEFKVMVLDNGAFHKAKSLQIPQNIILIFIPPYSPELNPAELVWLNIKKKITNVLHTDLENVYKILITETFIKSLCAFDYFFN